MAQPILARKCLIFRTTRYGAAPGQTAPFDQALGQIVRRHFDQHFVAGEHTDTVLAPAERILRRIGTALAKRHRRRNREDHRRRVLAESHRPYRRRFASSGGRLCSQSAAAVIRLTICAKNKFANAGFGDFKIS